MKVKVDVDGEMQIWLFLFKNETHNHPTEIEPFGGAATCHRRLHPRPAVGPFLRVPGDARDRRGRPHRARLADAGGQAPPAQARHHGRGRYSSYGNQIGLATGQVDEIYHPGYVAKRMEVGAVVGATPADHVRREEPAPGDKIILLGGRTARDGIGGATRRLQVAECGEPGGLRRRGAEGQRPDRAQAAASVPPRRRLPSDQALQRLRRGRRVRGHR